MGFIDIIKLFGIPAMIAGGFVCLFKYTYNNIKAIKLGLQALLRAQLIADYNKYSEKGYAPLYARDNFENCYAQYHILGANGVMDNIHKRFLELPTEASNERDNREPIKD